ncbi:MAG TPA: hypothetical protein DDW47_03080 [Lactobacillus acetotolerans]|nr:hypothetical protein [Lactobacillus acetotolerans]
MKTNLLKGLSVLFLGVVLAGCSASGSSDKSGSKKATQEPTKIEFAKNAQSSRQQLWYRVRNDEDGFGKSSTVDDVYVIKNGKITTYTTNFDLSDLDKKEDNQIVDLAKKEDKKMFKRLVKSENPEATYSEPKPEKLKLSAVTDNSGNNISSEQFDMHDITYNEVNRTYTSVELEAPLQNTFPILSKYYTGYTNEDNDEYLVTTVSKKNHEKVTVSMDKPSTKGIKVDDDD